LTYTKGISKRGNYKRFFRAMLQRGNVMSMKVTGLVKRGAIAFLLVGSIVLPLNSAWSQPQSAPDDGGGPPPGGPGKGHSFGGGGGGGQHHHHFPGKREIDQLTDLTPKQKTDIDAIYKEERQSIAPLMQQMRAARAAEDGGSAGAGAGGAGGAGGGAAAGGANGDLRAQLMAKRKETWEKVKAILTPQQIEELKSMQASAGGPGGPPPGGPGGKPGQSAE